MNRAVAADFALADLRQRAEVVDRKGSDAMLYRVTDEAEECGVVGLDLSADNSTVSLEELFVTAKRRGRGDGTAMIAMVEQAARSEGRTRIAVWAEPLEDDEDGSKKIDLIKWYKRRGFRSVHGRWDELEKLL